MGKIKEALAAVGALELVEAADAFAETMGADAETAVTLAPDFTCEEINAFVALLRAAGRDDVADHWLGMHAEGDDEGDEHYAGPDYLFHFDMPAYEVAVYWDGADVSAESSGQEIARLAGYPGDVQDHDVIESMLRVELGAES